MSRGECPSSFVRLRIDRMSNGEHYRGFKPLYAELPLFYPIFLLYSRESTDVPSADPIPNLTGKRGLRRAEASLS